MRKKKYRQLLIDMFINRIYLSDDKLVITFNHLVSFDVPRKGLSQIG